MKKLIISLVVLIGSAALIAMVLTNNKKENEAKIEIINQGDGKAAVKVTSVSLQDMDLSYSVNGNFAPIRELEMKSENPGIEIGRASCREREESGERGVWRDRQRERKSGREG